MYLPLGRYCTVGTTTPFITYAFELARDMVSCATPPGPREQSSESSSVRGGVHHLYYWEVFEQAKNKILEGKHF